MVATTHKSGHYAAPARSKSQTADERLRKERWMAAGIMLAFALIVALLLFLATLNGGAFGPNYEYWLMP